MNNKAHFNPKSMTWVISLVVMIIISAGVIFGSSALSELANKKYDKHYEVGFTVASVEEVDISGVNAQELGVTAVERALDESGNTVAYVVTGSTVGYNTEVPIEMKTTIAQTDDGTLVCGIDILHQEETEYLGVRIETPEFKQQFENRLLPVISSLDTAKGSKIDVISKSTISSEAVIAGVTNAQSILVDLGFIDSAE